MSRRRHVMECLGCALVAVLVASALEFWHVPFTARLAIYTALLLGVCYADVVLNGPPTP